MTMPNSSVVSVIIPCRNEERYIGRCLDSVVANEFPQDRLEVLVVDGESDDQTRAIVEDYAQRYPFVRLLSNPRRITPVAINTGIRAARGDVIMRMDAHATYAKDYIAKCVQALEQYPADNVGGIMRTIPRKDTVMGRAIAAALSHRFGVGGSDFRVHPKQPKWVDTVFGGCYRRSVFDRVGLFNEALARGQDMEFNLRLKKAGGRTLLVPDIVSSYYARADLLTFVRHNYGNGKWAILPFLHSSVMPVSWKQLVPLVFVATLLALGGMSRAGVQAAGIAFFGVAVAYAALTLAGAIGVALSQRDARFLVLMPIAFASLHLAYGVGSLVGVVIASVQWIARRHHPAASSA